MAKWYDMPTTLPGDGQQVWVRRTSWISPPFLAVWQESLQEFITTPTGLITPWSDIARWSPSAVPPTSDSIVLTGLTNPVINGTYTHRGRVFGERYYQLEDTRYFISINSANTHWTIAMYLTTTGQHYASMAVKPSLADPTGTYTCIGTWTGTPAVAWPI
jgi:hypothetical protein